MAGVWAPWTDKETGEHLTTFSLVTVAANPLMKQVHNTKERMPLILPDDLGMEWIKKDLPEQRIKELATYQFPASQMEAYPIQKDWRTAHNARDKFEYEDLPPIEMNY